MKKLTGNEMRQMWFDFWKSKGHKIVDSASLIPVNDPTLLWINAGVTPLKKYFDGTIIPDSKRLASSQKCIRTNDIENVGKTARHQTFFEMLGNFSIGDYFKTEAINWAFEFLTSKEWLEIDKNKLYVTIYTDDIDAYNLWTSVGIDPSHIVKLETNFWEIGAGPSGPDSEIFYDRGEKYDSDKLGIKLLQEEIDNDRYIEIWNNVFSMYNAKPGVPRSEYKELPSKNIDTGMGLERIVSILQEVETNFDTDLFLPIIKKIEEISGKEYKGEMTFKVIADHVRTITFALSDGANFGNTGRDYILRRLIRRAIRYGKKLGINGSFVSKIVPTVIEVMKEAYPYLVDKEQMVMNKVDKEEELFLKTLAAGEKKLEEIMATSTDKKISGEDAFKLYDTYGFPFELTLEYANESGYNVSKEEFDISMKKQKEMARNARSEASSMNVQNEELINFKESSTFVGYDVLSIDTKIIALFDGTNFVQSLTNEGYVVLEKTPFYAECGGQVSDTGIIATPNLSLEVEDLFKGPNHQHFHFVKFNGTISIGEEVKAMVDEDRRHKIMRNHSATHLLQKALKETLNENVHQAGSKVDDETLRFDFTYDNKISKEELIKIEELVNQKIRTNVDSIFEVMSLEEAKKTGATALFDEKYGDEVRVITLGDSKELCAGTHVRNLGDIERFAIKAIENKGNNVYRIEGATADNIEKELFEAIKPYNDDMMKLLLKAKKIVELAKEEEIDLSFDVDINHDAPHSYKDIVFNLDEMSKVKETVQSLEKEYNTLKSERILSNLTIFTNGMVVINNINTIIVKVFGFPNDVLKQIVDKLTNEYEKAFIFIANVNENNVNYFAKETANLKEVINCGTIVKAASMESSGNGGGSPIFAQGGGSDITNLDNIISGVKKTIEDIK